SEIRATAVVLEADEHAVRGLRDEITDEPLTARSRSDVHEPEAGDRGRVLGHVLDAEQLVSAADRERRRAARDRTTDGFAVRTPEVGTHDVLTLILAAAEEEDVGPVGVEAH